MPRKNGHSATLVLVVAAVVIVLVIVPVQLFKVLFRVPPICPNEDVWF